MRRRLLKTLTTLALSVLMIVSVISAFVLGIGADKPINALAAEGDTYQLVTDVSALNAGNEIVIVYTKGNMAMGAQNAGKYRENISVKITDNTFEYVEGVCVLTLGGSSGAWTLKASNGYLYYSGSKNSLNTDEKKSNYTWEIAISADNTATITSASHSGRTIQYNTGSPRFACYTTTQGAVSIYKLVENAGGCDHDWQETSRVDATCTKDGSVDYKCSVCNNTKTETLKATGHNYENGVCTECGNAAPSYELVALGNIKSTDTIIIVSTKGTDTYAMSNDKGTSAAPTAVPVTVGNNTITTAETNILWNISKDSEGKLTIYPAGKTEAWLYCTATNNGVRVGTNTNKVFIVDEDSKYLKHTGTNRYLGVYNNEDWRCYTNTTGNTAGQTFSFYKLKTGTECPHTNTTEAPEVPATCTTPGTTAGVYCNDCETYISGHEPIAIIAHTYDENGACTMCGKTLPFKVGDVVIFTGSKADGTDTQELTGFADGATYGTAEVYTDTLAGTFPITVVDGYQNGTYAFKNGDNYITCKGEKQVNLSTTLDNKSSWTVSFEDDGTCDIISCSNASWHLRYNPSSPRFTTYASGQQPIKVIKVTDPVLKGVALALNKGVTVKVTYDISIAWLALNKDAKVVFSNGEKDQPFEAKAGENVYSVDLTPAQINDDLTVKIQLADGTDFGSETDVSVLTYKTKVEAAYANGKLNYSQEKYDALIALLDAALTYSNAADGAIAEDLTNEFTGVDDLTITHANEAAKLFTGCAGTLSTYASVRIIVNTANISEGETLLINKGTGENVKELYNGDFANGLNAEGNIVIDGIYPLNFGDTISIEASDNSKATFTFNAYLKEVYNSSSDQKVKNFAVATYLYGLAAEGYLTA